MPISNDWIVQVIRNGLKSPGKTQVGLARALGRSEPVVSRIVSGERKVQIEEIERVFQYFEMPPDSLLQSEQKTKASGPIEVEVQYKGGSVHLNVRLGIATFKGFWLALLQTNGERLQ